MSLKSKTFLVILEINNVLFHLNNPRLATMDSHINQVPVVYQDTYKNVKVSYRKGKMQFLNYMFVNMKNDVDVAVWSNLNSQFTNDLCKKYFTRYYRDLLFILATNRDLYPSQPEHTSIKIRKDLETIYSRFNGYQSTNTIVVSAHQNMIEKYARNDLIVPEYTPANLDFSRDPGLTPLSKYLQGLLIVQKESGISDITRFINAKEAKNIFKRASHNMFSDIEYI